MSSKVSNLSGLKDLRASSFQVFEGLRDCEVHNGHLIFGGFQLSRVLKNFKVSRDERPFQGNKNPKIEGFKFSRVLNDLKFLKG